MVSPSSVIEGQFAWEIKPNYWKPCKLNINFIGTLKVADFGFARKFTNDDLSKTYCGSTAYTAPEVLRARGAYNAMLVNINLNRVHLWLDISSGETFGLGSWLDISTRGNLETLK